MIESWSQFCELLSYGLGCGFTVGFSAMLVRYIRFSYVRFFRSAANL